MLAAVVVTKLVSQLTTFRHSEKEKKQLKNTQLVTRRRPRKILNIIQTRYLIQKTEEQRGTMIRNDRWSQQLNYRQLTTANQRACGVHRQAVSRLIQPAKLKIDKIVQSQLQISPSFVFICEDVTKRCTNYSSFKKERYVQQNSQQALATSILS